MKTRNLGSGVNPCVAWVGDTIRCAWQGDPKTPDGRKVHEALYSADLEPVGEPWAHPLTQAGDTPSATPCYVLAEDGGLLIAYKDGAPNYPLYVVRPNGVVSTLDTRVQGHLASRRFWLWWQVATGPASWMVRQSVGDLSVWTAGRRDIRESDDAEGIAHIRADDWPLLRREWRTYSPLGTMPAVVESAGIVLAESIDEGLQGRWGNEPGWLSVFAGEETSDPRAALSADGQRLAVCGWGPSPGGIWLASVTKADLGLPHVARVGRAYLVGGFFEYTRLAGLSPAPLGNCTHVIDDACVDVPDRVALIPDVTYLRSRPAELFARWARVQAIFVGSDPLDSTPESVERNATEALAIMREAGLPRRPLIGYVDAPRPSRWPRNVEIVGLQCYPLENEDIGRCVRRVNDLMTDLEGRRVIKVWRSDDQNGTQPDPERMSALQFWAPRVANAHQNDEGTLFFSDRRGNGILRNPPVRLVIEAIAASVTAPAIETVGETEVERPRVEIVDWQLRTGVAPHDVVVQAKVFGGPAAALTFTAVGPPGLPSISIRVESPAALNTRTLRRLQPGRYSIHARVDGPGGFDQTTEPRPVIVTAAEEEPMAKPYDEQFYLDTAPPMFDGDPKGACNQAIADYAVMDRPVDGQYSIWFTRTETDYQNKPMALQESWRLHRNEMRAQLNPAGDKLPSFP